MEIESEDDQGSGVFVVFFDPPNSVDYKNLEFRVPDGLVGEWSGNSRPYALAATRLNGSLSVVAGGGVLVFGEDLPEEEGDLYGRIVSAWTSTRGFPLNRLDVDLEKRLYGDRVTELSWGELEAFRPAFVEAGEEGWLDEYIGAGSLPDDAGAEGRPDERVEGVSSESVAAAKGTDAKREKTAPQAEAHEAQPAVWLCQYNSDYRDATWVLQARPGSEIPWRIAGADIADMKVGDPVVYWRTIDRSAGGDRGGVVGTGRVVSPEIIEEEGEPRILTIVFQFDDNKPLPRDEVIEQTGLGPSVWRFSMYRLPADVAARMNALLEQRGFQPLFGAQVRQPAATATFDRDGYVTIRRDDAETDYDALGRAPLAVSFAWTLHEIWCTAQGLAPFPPRRPRPDTAGFVAHVDAPWGGGKTSFANLVARVLNPDLDGEIPKFLKDLYPDRDDMSGLFIAEAHETGKLKNEDGSYRWHELARRPWIIVDYNAWLHQHVDPPWWSFFQAIRKACFRAIHEEGLPTVVQDEDGKYRTKKEGWLNRFDRWRGLWVRELWWRLTSGKVVVSLLVLAASVLAVLLLRRYGIVDAEGGLSTSSEIGFVIAVLTGAGAFLTAAFTVFADALAPGHNTLAERVSLGSIDPLARFRRHFAALMRDVSRPVLVVIDDIDRCDPRFIVGMTRGLQTILKSPRVVYLLLGDRDWIEQAFEVCHQDMSTIDVGPEHTFGGRFVEKAIQLSFVLPAMGDQKEDYVREVLIGRHPGPVAEDVGTGTEEPGSAADTVEDTRPRTISSQARRELRDRIASATTAEDIDEAGAAEMEGGGAGDRAYQRAVREEVILQRTAQKDVIEQQIRHRLQPLAKYLPDNPRHVKRVINAISMYQNSILLTEDFSKAEFGGELWRRLVVGVVLMIGFPKSWLGLARDPELADFLIAAEEPPFDGSGGTRQENYLNLSRNPDFVGLLSETELWDQDPQTPVETKIDAEAVRWLNRTIPVAG